MGSLIRVPPSPMFDVDPLTFRLWFQPTLFGGTQHLVSWLDGVGNGVELVLEDDGSLSGLFCGRPAVHTGRLELRTWHLVTLSVNRTAGRATLSVTPKPRAPVHQFEKVCSAQVFLEDWAVGEAPLVIGGQEELQRITASEIRQIGTLFGRVAAPAIWAAGGRHLTPARYEGRPDPDSEGNLVAMWDLGADPSTDLCRDIGPHSHHGRVVNGGVRLLTGPHFEDAGSPPDPATHSSVHLHGDDVLDAGWEVDLTMKLPPALASGVYAIKLTSPDGAVEDHVPLFVRNVSERCRVAVVLPTFTYLAYGNERMNFGTIQLPDAERSNRLQPIDRFIESNPWLGPSLYDEHRDRSGVTRVSRHRPLATMRPEHRSWLSGDPRHLSADLYLIDWLEQHQIPYDVITDDEVHSDGFTTLEPYQVVLTGSHPEYVTDRILDGLQQYLATGGRLMYLGGNGYYWVTSVDTNRPEVIEVRRGHAGSRTWESWPGDERHSSTGEIGGLWRHRGRPPNELVGVGFAASGWGGDAGAYRAIQPVPERASFVFEGVDISSPIGDFGLIMGGCVGDEVDRWDPELGSPSQALRLATCTDLNQSYVIVVEDTIGTGEDITSDTNPGVRGDMVLMPTGNGGAVFSVGSMGWMGSLSHNGYNNPVSTITKNVLDRFLVDDPI